VMQDHGFTYVSVGRAAVYPTREIALAASASA
jgi:hypothetical protein